MHFFAVGDSILVAYALTTRTRIRNPKRPPFSPKRIRQELNSLIGTRVSNREERETMGLIPPVDTQIETNCGLAEKWQMQSS